MIGKDEDLTTDEFEAEERDEGYDFGVWPEVAGLALTGFAVWLMCACSGGAC